ncbi:SAM-dependent methyltransferase [Nocardia sp. CDC159]|uniref:SAM-dependent methyltransferase n=2 Tax=Nocardiaceae TaxID=85025 RepID=A0A9X2EFB3_9NOCA|nr:SAM-dependent methyltransferase [Nocardia pulmonis]MCM6790911.1 SAM-dependent methyltransferase [Nocardia sp. CDC159]
MRGVPEGVSHDKPNSARIMNYLLGGKDNFTADQEAARTMMEAAPEIRTLAWSSRQFLLEATRCAARAGITQFVDLGAGYPIEPYVHEVAQRQLRASRVASPVRVVAVDYDPVVRAHIAALVAPGSGVVPMLADIRDPDRIISTIRDDILLDLSEPVAVLCVGVLHFVTDNEGPETILATWRKAVAPGSYLAITHASDRTSGDFIAKTAQFAGTGAEVTYRSRDQIRGLMDGWCLLPDVTDLHEWLGVPLSPPALCIDAAIARAQ